MKSIRQSSLFQQYEKKNTAQVRTPNQKTTIQAYEKIVRP